MDRFGGVLILSVAMLGGCTSTRVLIPHAVDLVPAAAEIPEAQLLDVAVKVFDPGVPDGDISKDVLEELIEEGTFVHVRRAESVYMAVQLRDTLRRSGHWGSVWVTPEESMAADIVVDVGILQSNGDIVRVEVTAVDATGRTWIDEAYEYEAPAGVYNRRRYPNLDPYQDLFNSIANDLADARTVLRPADVSRIRTVAALRYAEKLVPARFDRYVAAGRSGGYEPVRLPAAGDPLFTGTERVRQRERLLFEALNQHYDHFAAKMATPYGSWREAAREESAAARDLMRSARWHKALGITATVASIASFMGGGGLDQNAFSGRFLRESMMLMGTNMLQTSAMHLQGSRLHEAAAEELAASFDDEAETLVVEIAGVEHRLTGTAERQFAEWRRLLRRMFAGEAGAAADGIAIYPEMVTIPAVEAAAER